MASQTVEDFDDISRDFNKIERNLKKIGLSDGISDGQQSIFQKYFDDGFSDGFRTGFAIGQYKGAIFASCKRTGVNPQEDPLLEDPKKGWCQICSNTELLNSDISVVVRRQNEVAGKNLKILHSTYSKTCNKVSLPQKSNNL